jgi:hypothetical protein
VRSPAEGDECGQKGATRIAKVPVKGGQTPAEVGYLEVYVYARMMCARTVAYNSKGVGVLIVCMRRVRQPRPARKSP